MQVICILVTVILLSFVLACYTQTCTHKYAHTHIHACVCMHVLYVVCIHTLHTYMHIYVFCILLRIACHGHVNSFISHDDIFFHLLHSLIIISDFSF